MPVHPQLVDFVTIGLLVVLEGLLSADNALVLAVLVLGLPKARQQHALRYGIGGAFLFRIVTVIFAIRLIALPVVKLGGALYLLWLSFSHFFRHRGAERQDAIRPPRPLFGLPPFWATVVRVELTDFVFAVDSILVAVAMSSKAWVVIAGGLLGIVAMRLVVGRLLEVVRRHPTLVHAAFVIIAWVGSRLLLEWAHEEGWIAWEIPTNLSLAVVALIIVGAYAYARRRGRRGVRS